MRRNGLIRWAILLSKGTKDDPEARWFLAVSADGIMGSKAQGHAQLFDTEEAAEATLETLVSDYGLEQEDGCIEMLAADDHATLNIGSDKVSVSPQSDGNNSLLVVRFDGIEHSADLPQEVGETLAKFIAHLRTKLR